MTSRTVCRLGVLLALVMTMVGTAAAQGVVAISGTVGDEQQQALPGVTITVIEELTGTRWTAVTRQDGGYSVTGLRVGGPYRMSASIQGFRTAVVADIQLVAGAPRREDFTLAIAGITEQLTVRAGTALARDDKRAASNIVDVVSADAVGRFPDNNAAEALRRVPGVSMEIDQGEGRFVVVRGIDATLNNVTINGQIVGTPAEFGTRGVSMDSVPADLISRLEVSKAVRPDMDANAIGASINIQTVGAFDRPEGFMSGTVRSGYNQLSGRAPYGANFSIGRVLGAARRWGVVLGASVSDRRFDSDLFRASDGAFATFNGFPVPQNQGFLLYDVDRRRRGVNGALGFRPRQGHELNVRVNYNFFRDIEGRQLSTFDLTRGTLSQQTPTSGAFSQGRATREYRDYEQNHKIGSVQVSGEHTLALGRLDWRVGTSRGERDTPRRVDWEFRSGANAFPNRYDMSDPARPVVTPNAAFYDPASYPFRRVRFRSDLEREDVFSAEVNLRRDLTLAGRSSFVKVGAKVVGRDKTQDRTNVNYNGVGFTLAQFGLGLGEPDRYFEGRYRFGPRINLPVMQRFFQDNPGFFTFDEATSIQNSLAQDFTADETVPAGYGMVGVDFAKGNVMGGVRVEHTRANYSAFELISAGGVFNGANRPTAGETSYTNALPGVHLNLFPRRNVVLRAAWTNTIGRPAYSELAPIRALDEVQDEPGVFVGSLSTGNSGLKPYESMNLDLSLEYYLPSGLISIAPFHKRIDNPIYSFSESFTNYTYEGRVYERFGVSRPENAENGRITGVELTYQDYFTFLPGAFSGLGVNLNYTKTRSSVEVFGRTGTVPFFKQSDDIGTFAVLYEKYGVSSQLSLSFNTPALGSVGATAATDNFGDTYRVVDFKLSLPVQRGIRAFVEFGNLNDERRRRYAGAPELRVQDEIYSWNMFAGLDLRFR